MNYRILLVFIGIILLCGAIGRPLQSNSVWRRCGPPMTIRITDNETGKAETHFAIPVWYEYPSVLGGTKNKAMKGFHFELQNGTVLPE